MVIMLSGNQRELTIAPRHRAFYPALILLVATWVTFGLLKDNFLAAENLENLLSQTVPTALAALAITLLLIVGQVDLSVAAIGGLSATVFATVLLQHTNAEWLAWLAALGLGAIVGATYGMMAALLPIPSFVLTLAGLMLLTGIQLWVLSPQGSRNLPYTTTTVSLAQQGFVPASWLWVLLTGGILTYAGLGYAGLRRRRRELLDHEATASWALRWGVVALGLGAFCWYLSTERGVAVIVLGLVVVVAITDLALRYTGWGYGLYTIGHSARIAKLAGIRVTTALASVWIFSGILAALAGVVSSARLAAVHHSTGATDFMLTAFAAALIGGASTRGGRGSAWSALIGALVIQSLINGLTLLQLPLSARLVLVGVVLAGATIADALVQRKKPGA